MKYSTLQEWPARTQSSAMLMPADLALLKCNLSKYSVHRASLDALLSTAPICLQLITVCLNNPHTSGEKSNLWSQFTLPWHLPQSNLWFGWNYDKM